MSVCFCSLNRSAAKSSHERRGEVIGGTRRAFRSAGLLLVGYSDRMLARWGIIMTLGCGVSKVDTTRTSPRHRPRRRRTLVEGYVRDSRPVTRCLASTSRRPSGRPSDSALDAARRSSRCPNRRTRMSACQQPGARALPAEPFRSKTLQELQIVLTGSTRTLITSGRRACIQTARAVLHAAAITRPHRASSSTAVAARTRRLREARSRWVRASALHICA
jgi:hypothetical protein